MFFFFFFHVWHMWLPRALLREVGYLFPRERAPGWGLVRDTCPLAWARKDRGVSFVCSVPLGKSLSLLHLGIAAKAGSAGSPSAGWQRLRAGSRQGRLAPAAGSEPAA